MFGQKESIVEKIFWLTINCYHEARGEPARGRVLVCKVALNRTVDKRWPDTVKKVVWQNDQFSWTSERKLWKIDGRKDEYAALLRCALSAWKAYLQWRVGAREGGINHYHRYDVYPYWRHAMVRTEQVNNHIFYVG